MAPAAATPIYRTQHRSVSMWNFLRGLGSAAAIRRSPCRPAPGPLAGLARDYAALDATYWAAARRRVHPADVEAR